MESIQRSFRNHVTANLTEKAILLLAALLYLIAYVGPLPQVALTCVLFCLVFGYFKEKVGSGASHFEQRRLFFCVLLGCAGCVWALSAHTQFIHTFYLRRDYVPGAFILAVATVTLRFQIFSRLPTVLKWWILGFALVLIPLLVFGVVEEEPLGIKGAEFAATWCALGLLPAIGFVAVRENILGRAATFVGLQNILFLVVVAVLIFFQMHWQSLQLFDSRVWNWLSYSSRPFGIHPDDEFRVAAFTLHHVSCGPVAAVGFFLTWRQPHSWQKCLALLGWLGIVVFSGARAGFLMLAICVAVPPLVEYTRRRVTSPRRFGVVAATACLALALLARPVFHFVYDMRPASSHQRQEIVTATWGEWTRFTPFEFMFGRAPAMRVKEQPVYWIATHDTLASTLYGRGLLGAAAVLISLFALLSYLVFLTVKTGETSGLVVMLSFLVFTLSERVNDLPGHSWLLLVALGCYLREVYDRRFPGRLTRPGAT